MQQDTNIQKRNEKTSDSYVIWEGIKIRIPTCGYVPAGFWREYTPEIVTRTLDHYNHQLTRGNTNAAMREEQVEKHDPSLLDSAVSRILKIESNGLFEKIKHTLGNERIKRILKESNLIDKF